MMNYYDYRSYFQDLIDLLEEYLPEYSSDLDSIISSLGSILGSLESILSTLDTFLPFLLIIVTVKLVSSWW